MKSSTELVQINGTRNIEGYMRKTFARLIEKWAKLINKHLSVYPQPLHNIFWCWFSSVIIFKFPRTAGYVFHAEHQQPGGGDEEEEAAEAGEEVATVQEQGFHFSSFCCCHCCCWLLLLMLLLMLMFWNIFCEDSVIMNLGQDGAPDTGGTLKIYGEALRKEVFFTK